MMLFGKGVTKMDKFDEMYEGKWYTIIGVSPKHAEELKKSLISALMVPHYSVGMPKKFYTFTSKELNEKYKLTGKKKLNENKGFFAFSREGLNMERLEHLREFMGDYWFHDVVNAIKIPEGVLAEMERYAKKLFLKKEYPKGTRVRLKKMNDPQAIPVGTEGTVMGIDDMGDLLMKWDNGSSLKLNLLLDEFEKIK